MRRGTRVGEAYVAVTADGSGINDDIVDGVNDAGPGIDKAGKEHGDGYGERFSEGFRGKLDGLREKIAGKLGKDLADEGESAGGKAGDRAGTSFSQRMSERLTRGDFADRIGEVLGDRIGEAVGDRIEMALAAALDSAEDMLDRNRKVSRNPQTPGKDDDSGGLGSLVGNLLGSGSRNNALNLFGKAVGGLITGVSKLTNLGQEMFSTFSKGWTEAGEGASFFQKGISGAGAAGSRAMAALAESGPAAAAAIVVVTIAMSVMVSVASALMAIVTALASTIVSGLVGALLVGTAGLAAMAAAGGLVVAAFMSMTDAQKALLTDAFQPLHAEMIGIGQLMITQMIPYFGVWSENLQKALYLAAPVAAVMGDAFGKAGAAITAAASGPGFQLFAQMLGVFLPSIVLRLSTAFGNLGNGVTAVFAMLLPLVDRFSGYLEQVTQRFSEWANSAGGQNAIVDFADRAVESLQSLWNFVREFSGFIADVLFSPEAQAFGNTMFDSLAASFEELRKKIDSGDLEKWFKDAKDFGEDLWRIMVALGESFQALNNSGVLDATGFYLSMVAGSMQMVNFVLEPLIDLFGFGLTNALNAVMHPLQAATDGVLAMRDAVNSVLDLISKVPRFGDLIPEGARFPTGGSSSGSNSIMDNITPSGSMGNGLGVLAGPQSPTIPSLGGLISSGNNALANTSVDAGGTKKTPKWKNPYIAYANSLIDEETGVEKIRDAMKKAKRTIAKAMREGYADLQDTLGDINKNAAKAILKASTADDSDSVVSALQSVIESAANEAVSASRSIVNKAKSTADSLRSTGASLVSTARSALNSAASSLASASTPAAASEALKEVHAAEKALDKAEKAAKNLNKRAKDLIAKAKADATAMRKGIAAANKILEQQEAVNPAIVQGLINGNGWAKMLASLADFAAAREFVADQLEKANKKLADAIAMRDEYKKAVSDGIKAFGALTTAQAQTINGVEQALTSTDITTNLQTRLDKIKKFQDNLRILLANGLSDAAYRQIVDMGVEGGSAFADALVAGGQGAISETNSLTEQIGTIGDSLGLEASNRMYQAGVDAAQGLVDGLTSLSTELDTAATALGEAIAAAVRKALGINSPSRVMIGMMDYVGDGAVVGLDNQGTKVGRAARRFSDNIAVSPEVAAYAARQGASPVSGNGDQRPIELTVITPTEDPMAVATEAINELMGRL